MEQDFVGGDISDQGPRPQGTMGHSSNYAKLSGLLIPSALSAIFFSATGRQKFFGGITWAITSIALMLTISRAGIATWVITPLLLGLGLVQLRIVNLRRFIAMSLLPLLFTAMILLYIGGERFQSRVRDDDGSLSLRKPMFEVAINMIKEHPLLGVGLNNYTLVQRRYDHTPEDISVRYPDSSVHNLYLLYAAEMGIPGLMLFLWFVGLLLKDSLSLANRAIGRQEKLLYLSLH